MGFTNPQAFCFGVFLSAGGAFVAAYELPVVWLLVLGLTGACYGFLFSLIRPAGPDGAGASGGNSRLLNRSILLIVFLIALPAIFFFYHDLRYPGPGDHDPASWLGCKKSRGCVLRLTVIRPHPLTEARLSRYFVAAHEMIFPDRIRLSGFSILNVYGAKTNFENGAGLEVKGKLSQIVASTYPWQFDYRDYLAKRRVFSEISASFENVRSTGPTDRAETHEPVTAFAEAVSEWLAGARRRIVRIHRTHGGSPEGDILASLVLGDRAVKLPGRLSESFRNIGLAHLLAASGFNLAIVTGTTYFVLQRLTLTGPVLNLSCFLSMLLFVGLAGPSPSVMRAALMCALLLLGKVFARRVYTAAALALALLVNLVWDPVSVSDIGLQLSYSATLGIICGAGVLSKRLSDFGVDWPVVRDTAAVVICAQAAVLPVQLAHFWETGLLFLPANLIISPVIPAVTVIGFVSSSIILLDSAGVFTDNLVFWIDTLAGFMVKPIILAVRFLDSLEGSKLVVGPPSSQAILIYYFCLVLAAFLVKRKEVVWPALLSVVCAVLIIVWRPCGKETKLAFFSDAVVAVTGGKEAVCVGKTRSICTKRFLLHHGIAPRLLVDLKGAAAITANFPAQVSVGRGYVSFMLPGRPLNVLVADMNELAGDDELVESLPGAAVLVISASLNRESGRNFRREIARAEKIADRVNPSWIVCPVRYGRFKSRLGKKRKLVLTGRRRQFLLEF